MAEDITIKPGKTDFSVRPMQREELVRETVNEERTEVQYQQNQAQSVVCPSCGTVNDAEAMFCASCGRPLKMASCPNCGSEIDPDADFCEVLMKE